MDMIDFYIILIVALALISVVVYFIIMELKFKHRIIFRDLTNDRKIIKIHRAREYMNKQGIEFWQIAGEKRRIHKNIAAPPEDAIEITEKGRKFAEAYRTQSGNLIWITDKNKVVDEDLPDAPLATPELPKWITEIKDKEKRKIETDKFYAKHKVDIDTSKRTVNSYQPLTANQRMILINNIKKAEMKKGIDWKQQLVPIVSIAAIALIVVSLMVFWGDLTKPTLQANEQFIQAQSIHKETMEILLEIKTGQQKIEQKVSEIEQNVPD